MVRAVRSRAIPSAVRGPVLRPPCMRQRNLPWIAGARQRQPLRVLAPRGSSPRAGSARSEREVGVATALAARAGSRLVQRLLPGGGWGGGGHGRLLTTSSSFVHILQVVVGREQQSRMCRLDPCRSLIVKEVPFSHRGIMPRSRPKSARGGVSPACHPSAACRFPPSPQPRYPHDREMP